MRQLKFQTKIQQLLQTRVDLSPSEFRYFFLGRTFAGEAALKRVISTRKYGTIHLQISSGLFFVFTIT